MSVSDQLLPEEFGPYTLFERLGLGGMASVHRAVHRATGNVVALKRLLPQLAADKNVIKQFVREGDIAKAIAHPNIVGVEDFGWVGGERYLAMEYLRGQSVLQLLRRANEDSQPAPVGVAVWILHEILSALDHAMTGLDEDGRAFNVVHRDLSPSNIILTPNGVVKLIDFGVAKALEGRYATNSGRIKGKLGYMPPEVLAGRKVDQRSDLFSTAIVTWELLTAQRLFRGTDNEQLTSRARKHQKTPPSSINRWVPNELDTLLALALEEDPDKRWESAKAMLEALTPILQSQGEGASAEAVAKWCKQLRIAEGVLDHTRTNHNVPLSELLPARKPAKVILPNTQINIPGVRRFVDAAHTVVDAEFDPNERHLEVTGASAPAVRSGFGAGEMTEAMEPLTEDSDEEFNDVGTTASHTASSMPKNER